ncbi:MAG TPA: peptidase C25, partial [Thermoplasmatales archaeon]|nr:peptidase C25 [Thermoplasmatales archaeon]
MQRKIYVSMQLVILLILNTFVVVGLSDATSNAMQDKLLKVYSITLSEPCFGEKEGYVTVDLKEAASWLMEAGKPMLPVVTKVLAFPLGTRVLDVNVSIKMKKYVLDKRIKPAPKPAALDGHTIHEFSEEDKHVYGSTDLYPSDQYVTKTGAGLKNGEHVLYLNVRCYTQYSPANNLLYVPEEINIKVSYQPPEKPFLDSSQYDLLIVTDEKFVPYLQPLVDHKNSIGIKTKMETTQYVYSHCNGRDKPESIKLFIKDALEQWGIKYVLLAGGRKGQTLDWYIPERRSNNDVDMESGYSTDLYYADIYRCDNSGNLFFDDWDSNGNGVFAEWSCNETGRDVMDY